MSHSHCTIPVYQTVSPGSLLRPVGDQWKSVFPFNDRSGRWAFTGRVALHWGLPSLRLPPGSTILVPSYFQGTEIDTLLYNRYVLRFYRVDRRLRVDLQDAQDRMDASVSAFYAIHYLGWPQPMGPIQEFCHNHNIRLIEDCALALFSRDGNTWLGTSGDMALYSVYKTLALPHGGFLVTKGPGTGSESSSPPFNSTAVQVSDLVQEHLKANGWGSLDRSLRAAYAILKKLAGKRIDATVGSGRTTFDPGHLTLGVSGWVPHLMKSVNPERVIAHRRRNYEHLARRLQGRVEVLFPELPEGVCPLYFGVFVDDKPAMVAKLANEGVGSINVWWDDHTACPADLACEVSYLRRRLLELPIHQSLSEDQVDRVADVFLTLIGKR